MADSVVSSPPMAESVVSSTGSFTTIVDPDAMAIGRRCSHDISAAKNRAAKNGQGGLVVPLALVEDISPNDSISVIGQRAHDRCSLESLSALQVSNLLVALDLARYAQSFLSLPIRGADLAHATEEDLKDAGVSVALHRRSLMRQIEEFRLHGVPKAHIVAAPPPDDGWRQLVSDQGQRYFLNEASGETSWQLPAGVADLSGAWAAAGYDEADFPPIYLYHEPWCRGGAPADAASYVFSGYTIEE